MTFQVRYLMLAIMALTTCVLYITRISLSVVLTAMTVETSANSSSEFKYNVCPVPSGHFSNSSNVPSSATAPRYDWSQSTQGLILGAFFYPYILMQTPAGLLSKTFGGKWIVCVSLLASGIINLVTPLVASSPLFFVLLRIFLGIAQGGVYAAAYGLLHSWFPEAQRSTAYAMLSVGSNIGTIIANSMTGALSEYGFAGGWPSVFYVSGLVGIAYVLIAFPLLTSKPSEHKWISKDELSLINADREIETLKNHPQVPWLQILTSKRVLVLFFNSFTNGFCTLMLSSKLPTYFSEILHISPTENGIINAAQYLVQFVTLFTAAPMSEYIIAKGWLSRTNTRKLFVAINCFGLGFFTMLIPIFGCSEYSVLTIMILTNVVQGLSAAGTSPIPGEMTLHFPAILFGLANTFEMSNGFVAPSVAGWILDSGEDIMFQWKILFVTSGCIAISGGLLFVLFAEAERQPWDIEQDDAKPLISCVSLDVEYGSTSSSDFEGRERN